MKTNPAMARIITDGFPALNSLPPGLQEKLDAGWIAGPSRSLLLAGAYGDGAGWRKDWDQREVGQKEYEVNDIYIESWGLPADKAMFQAIMASRAFAFAVATTLRARGMEDANSLVCVVSISDGNDYLTGGTTVRFYTRRGSFPKHFDGDLEKFTTEAIAVLDMRDAEDWPAALAIGLGDQTR